MTTCATLHLDVCHGGENVLVHMTESLQAKIEATHSRDDPFGDPEAGCFEKQGPEVMRTGERDGEGALAQTPGPSRGGAREKDPKAAEAEILETAAAVKSAEEKRAEMVERLRLVSIVYGRVSP